MRLIRIYILCLSFASLLPPGILFSKNSKNPEADSLRRAGIRHSFEGNYHLAMQCLYSALSKYEASNDSSRYALTLINIGILNYELEDYDKALEYFNQSLDIYRLIQDEVKVAQITNNKGLVYYQKGEFQKALDHFQRSIGVMKKHNFHPSEYNYTNIGRVYAKMKQYDSAIAYFKKDINIIRTATGASGSQDSIEVFHDLGKTYLDINRVDDALKQFLISFSTSGRRTDNNYIAANAKFIASIYEQKGMLDSALFFSKMYAAYADSAFYKKNNKAIAKIETKYAIDQINRKNHEDIQKRNLIIYASLGGIGLLTGFVILISFYYKRNRRNERLLRLRNDEINRQKISKLEQEQEIKTIKANIEGQEKERRRIAEELHDGIGGNLSAIKLSLMNTNNDQLGAVVKRLDATFDEVRAIAHNLALPGIHLTSFTNVLSHYFDEINQASTFELKYQFYTAENLNEVPDRYKTELYRIIQEATNNIIKHAHATYVEVQIIADQNTLNLMIEDNGIGFDPAEDSHGMGLNNIRSRVSLLHGELDIDSQPGRGTVLNINIGINNLVNHESNPTNHIDSR